jgi:8-oxo-dGTP pyrophosphatase MutT (NUDIX family)
LNKKYNPGKYGLVGGHVEKDDSIEDTLIKEVAEEIGYDISKLNKINLGVAKPAGLYKSFAYNFLIFIPNKIPNPSLQVTEVECIEYLDYSFVRESVKNNEDKFSITWDRYSDIFNRLDKILKYDSFANNTVDKFAKYFRNDKIFFFPSKENERKEVLNEIIRR